MEQSVFLCRNVDSIVHEWNLFEGERELSGVRDVILSSKEGKEDRVVRIRWHDHTGSDKLRSEMGNGCSWIRLEGEIPVLTTTPMPATRAWIEDGVLAMSAIARANSIQ